jgi:hypothetical protein
MALTVSIDKQDVFGSKRVNHCTIGFDSSYPTGGESLTARNLGLSGVDLVLFEPALGHTFEYDHTNLKAKVYRQAPPIVFEEIVTLTHGTTYSTATLKYPHAFIMYISAGDVGVKVVNGNCNPPTTCIAVTDPVEGVCPTLTSLHADAYTTLKVTYVTQAWRDVFENVVHAKLLTGARVAGHADLSFTAGTPDVIKLGEVAAAIQNITWVTAAGVVTAIDPVAKGVTSATLEAEVDFTDAGASDLTTVSIVTTDNVNAAGDVVYIDYIRLPSSGFLYDRWVEEDACTPSTDVITISTGVGYCQNLLLFGTCGQFPAATTKSAKLIATAATVGTDINLVKPTLWNTVGSTANTFTFGSSHDDAVLHYPTYIWGWPWEIEGVAPLEVRAGTNLSSLTGVKCMVIGF